MKKAKILLIGNPNCGKSTIFNSISGGGAHVGNYSGVTVEGKSGVFKSGGAEYIVEDMPGIYSISPSSSEESIVRDVLSSGDFDLIVNVIDSSNLERNLFLTIQLTEMGVPMAAVLNMSDELEKSGRAIDAEKFSEILGIPAIKSVGFKNSSARELRSFIARCADNPREPVFLWSEFKSQILYGYISNLSHLIRENLPESAAPWSRYLAIRAVEGDEALLKSLSEKSPEILKEAEKTSQKIFEEFGESSATLIAAARFSIAKKIASSCVKKIAPDAENPQKRLDDALDKVLLNRFLGIPIFLGLMFLCFQFVFALGDPLMRALEGFFSRLAAACNSAWAGEGAMKSLAIDGVIGGVGGVLVFLPNIALLFCALAVLEDSGYMARAAFLCDRLMRRFGLSGTSLIPMLVGFGCSVPGIMAARTLKSRVERLATIMVLPLFSCGARFSVFMLLIPAFFPKEYRVFILFGVYLSGIVLALVFAKILRLSIFKGGESAFILELPPYRLPRPRNVLKEVSERSLDFLKKAGTLILGMSILLWGFSNYPQKKEFSADYAAQISSVSASNLPESEKAEAVKNIENQKLAEKFSYTVSGRIGAGLAPVFSPIGFDEKISSALMGAFVAKEIFISQLGIVYGMGDSGDEGAATLREKLSSSYTPLQGLSIILFMLIAMPCIATIFATYSETKSAKLALIQAFGLTALAYAVCFAVYRVGLLLF